MIKKVIVTAAIGAAVVGGGTAALASSGNTSFGAGTASSASTSASTAAGTAGGTSAKTAKHQGRERRLLLRRALHATWVTRDGKTSTFVTHDAIRGSVTAVSTTSITVKAADGVSETFKVDSTTKVRVRPTTKGAKATTGTIGAVKSGLQVLVVGKGSGTPTATHILVGIKH